MAQEKIDKFKYPVYLIKWDDAESELTWRDEPTEELQPCICTTIGFLIRNGDYILVGDSYFIGTDGKMTIGNTVKIPKGMVREMYEVTLSKKRPRRLPKIQACLDIPAVLQALADK